MIRSRFVPVCIGLLLAGPVPSGRAGAEDRVDFARDIRLILAPNCYECHGPETQQSRLRLDREADAAERPRLPPRSPLEALKAFDSTGGEPVFSIHFTSQRESS
jgi:hypothetical protein